MEHFGLPVPTSNPGESPFRSDNTPDHHSFSIHDEGRRFKDHKSGYEAHYGDSFDCYQLASGKDAKQAFKEFIELAGLGHELTGRSQHRSNGSTSTAGSGLPQVLLPCKGRNEKKFCTEIGKIVGPLNVAFMRQGRVEEVADEPSNGKRLDRNKLARGGLRFRPFTGTRMKGWIEQHLVTGSMGERVRFSKSKP